MAVSVGILHRKEIARDLDAIAPDVVELIVENFLDGGLGLARRIAKRRPVIAHGVDASLGTDTEWPAADTDRRAEFLSAVGAAWFGEHLSFSRLPGRNLGHLTPLPFTREAVRVVSRNARRMQARIPCPLILENITYYFVPGRAEMSEAEFVTAVLDETGCGLLLDLNNLHANAVNHGYDARAFLDAIPIDRTVEIHLAGGRVEDGLLVDSHDSTVGDPVWSLLEETLARCAPKAIVLERDSRIPPAAELARELERARRACVAA